MGRWIFIKAVICICINYHMIYAIIWKGDGMASNVPLEEVYRDYSFNYVTIEKINDRISISTDQLNQYNFTSWIILFVTNITGFLHSRGLLSIIFWSTCPTLLTFVQYINQIFNTYISFHIKHSRIQKHLFDERWKNTCILRLHSQYSFWWDQIYIHVT